MKMKSLLTLFLMALSISASAANNEFRLVLTKAIGDGPSVSKTFVAPSSELISIELDGATCTVDATGFTQDAKMDALALELKSGSGMAGATGLVTNDKDGFLGVFQNEHWCFVAGN